MPEAPPERTRRWLNAVLIVAIADALLLIPLIYGVIADVHSISPIVGPIHGVGYVLLLAMTSYGAFERMWGWWFPVATLVTLGPPGSIIGDIIIRRRLNATGSAFTKPAADAEST